MMVTILDVGVTWTVIGGMAETEKGLYTLCIQIDHCDYGISSVSPSFAFFLTERYHFCN